MTADINMVLAMNASVTAVRPGVSTTGGTAQQTDFARMLAGLVQGGANSDGAAGGNGTALPALWRMLAPNADLSSIPGLKGWLGLPWQNLPLAGSAGSSEGDAFLAALREWAEGLMRLLGLTGEGEDGQQASDTSALQGVSPDAFLAALFAALGIGIPGTATGFGPDENLPVYGTRLQELLAGLANSPNGAELAKAIRQILQQGQPVSADAESLPEELQQLLALAKSAVRGNPSVASGAGGETAQLPGGKAETAQTSQQTALQTVSGLRSDARQQAVPAQAAIAIRGEGAGENATHTAGRTAVPAGAEPAAENGPVPVWMLRGLSVAGQPEKAELPPRVPVQQLVEQFVPNLLKKLTLQGANGVTEARISLHPEHLGHVDIRLSLHNGLLTAQFITATGMAKELLEAQMAQLKAAIQVHGLQVERMEVVQQSPSSSVLAFLHHHGRQPGSGDGRHGAYREERGAGYREAADFEAALERSEILQDIYGSSINLTA